MTSFDEFYAQRLGLFGRLRDHGISVVTRVDAGWPVAQALVSATSVAAEACGLGGETGRLAAGYAADVLVADGDLAEDVTALGRPREILVRGTYIQPHAP